MRSGSICQDGDSRGGISMHIGVDIEIGINVINHEAGLQIAYYIVMVCVSYGVGD